MSTLASFVPQLPPSSPPKEPSAPGLTNCSRENNSSRSFWTGVPVISTRRGHSREVSACGGHGTGHQHPPRALQRGQRLWSGQDTVQVISTRRGHSREVSACGADRTRYRSSAPAAGTPERSAPVERTGHGTGHQHPPRALQRGQRLWKTRIL